MLTDRRYAKRMQKDSRVEIPLILSVLMHVFLGLGIYFISKPHPPKESGNVQATLITADMLRDMKAQIQQNKAESLPESIPEEPNQLDLAESPVTNNTENDLVPSVLVPNAQKKPTAKAQNKSNRKQSERIFEPVPDSERKKNKPIEQPKVKKARDLKVTPLGEPDKKGIEETKEWAKKQQKVLDDMKRQKKDEEARKQKIQQRERDALAARRAEDKRKQKEKRDAEQQRLEDMKKAEKEKDQKLAERRKEIEAAKKAQRARQEKERKREAEQRRKDTIAKGSKSLGIDDEFAKEAQALSSGPSAAQISKAKATYIGRIKRKVTRNFKGKVDHRVVVPVKITLRPGGGVVSVNVRRSSGNLALDRSIEQAIHNSSPLPVPDDIAIFNKTFKSFTFEFVAE